MQQTVLVMSFFGPRVREKQINIGDLDPGRQRVEKFARLHFEKLQVGEPRAIPLFQRAPDAFADEVNPDTEPVAVALSVGGEKVSVAAPDFQHAARVRRQRSGERVAMTFAARGEPGLVCGGNHLRSEG